MNLRINEYLLVSSRRECRYAGGFQVRRGRETWGLRWVQTWYQRRGPKRRKFRRIRTTRRSQTVCLQTRGHRRSSSSTSASASPSPHLVIASSSGSLSLVFLLWSSWMMTTNSLSLFVSVKLIWKKKRKKRLCLCNTAMCFSHLLLLWVVCCYDHEQSTNRIGKWRHLWLIYYYNIIFVHVARSGRFFD